MTYIKEQYINVRVVSTGSGINDSDTVQYFDGTDWVDYLTVYQFEDSILRKRDDAVYALRRKYDTKEVYFVRNQNEYGSLYDEASKDVYYATPINQRFIKREFLK